jgi:DNA polymerase I-like protein with 3'-5' exonuclease and polymerase domains
VGPVRTLVHEEMVRAYPLDPALEVEVGVGPTWLDAK